MKTAIEKNEQLKAIDQQKLATAIGWVVLGFIAAGIYAAVHFTSLSNHLID